MPIYAYKCASCGFAKDALQKLSDAPLTVCPNCGKATFQKQLTAAGFQLKGTGWYVTDFRGGNASSADVPHEAHGKGEDKGGDAKPESGAASGAAPKGESKGESAGGSAPSAPAAAPSSSPAPAASSSGASGS